MFFKCICNLFFTPRGWWWWGGWDGQGMGSSGLKLMSEQRKQFAVASIQFPSQGTFLLLYGCPAPSLVHYRPILFTDQSSNIIIGMMSIAGIVCFLVFPHLANIGKGMGGGRGGNGYYREGTRTRKNLQKLKVNLCRS